MATVAELERLDALVRRLLPMTAIQSGSLIRATDWNALVGAVLELARAVLANHHESVVGEHEHVEQVTLGWLAPPLRALIERGALSDPAAAAKLADLERRVGKVDQRTASTLEEVGKVRLRLEDVTTRDLIREDAVTKLGRAVDARMDPRDEITTLRESLGSIQKDLASAIDVGKRLVVDGEPVDVEALVRGVSRAEELRARLVTPAGVLMDATTLEQRFIALTNTLVTETELSEALENSRVALTGPELDKLRDGLRVELSSSLTASLNRTEQELKAQTATQLAGVDARVSSAVLDASQSLRTSLLAEATAHAQSADEKLRVETLASVQHRIEELGTTIRTELSTQVSGLKATVDGVVRESVQREIPPHLTALRKDIEGLSSVVSKAEQQRQELTVAVQKATLRVEQLAKDNQLELSAVKKSLIEEMDRRFKDQDRALDLRIAEVNTQLVEIDHRSVQRSEQAMNSAVVASSERAKTIFQSSFEEAKPEFTKSLTASVSKSLEPSVLKLVDKRLDSRLPPR